MKKLLIRLRTLTKFSILILTAVFLIVGTVIILFQPIYSVYLDGELIGYCKDKSKLQYDITKFSESGDDSINTKNLAFISIENMPTYKACLLKRDIVPNDEEILETIKKTGVPYYKYYAILNDDEEAFYVADFETAENIVKELKDKESDNIDDISIQEKYETELKKFSDQKTVVSKLYKEKPIVTIKKQVAATSSNNAKVSTSRNMSKSKVSLGISLIRPISGRISSRFGSISRLRSGAHTGLDIASSSGTPIKAAADGVVVFAGTKGAYGKMVAINHGNNVLTYYGHCSKLYVSAGTTVRQGKVIAAVGSTGNSTGPHLHLEIRVNGVAYNPQNYVY